MLGLVIFPSYFGNIPQIKRDPKDVYLYGPMDPVVTRRLKAKVTGIIRQVCGGRDGGGFISAFIT